MNGDHINPPEGMSIPKLALWAGQVTQWIKGANGSFASAAKHFQEIHDTLIILRDKIDHLHGCTEQAKQAAASAHEETKATLKAVNALTRRANDGRGWSSLVRLLLRYYVAVTAMLLFLLSLGIKVVGHIPMHEQFRLVSDFISRS